MKTSSAWRTEVASAALRLSAQLSAAIAEGGDRVAGGVPAATARGAIERAQGVAAVPVGAGPVGRLRDWWSGASIETAWQALHLAGEQLMLMQPDGAGDPEVALSMVSKQHAAADADQQQIRSLRNVTTLLFAVVLALDVVLWLTRVTTGAVVGIGALAGALCVVFAVRAGTPPGPYSVLPAQTVLKVVSGAATALLATKILDFAAGVPASAARDSMYAVVFGFSQQTFTRMVDQRAGMLAQRMLPRAALLTPAMPVPHAPQPPGPRHSGSPHPVHNPVDNETSTAAHGG